MSFGSCIFLINSANVFEKLSSISLVGIHCGCLELNSGDRTSIVKLLYSEVILHMLST